MSAGLTKVNGHTAQQGDSFLPAASRVHQGWQRFFCFLLLIVAPSGVVYMYDKNHYNKFCHLPNCKVGRVQDSLFPFPTFPLLTSLPPAPAAAYHGIYFAPLSKSDAAFRSTRSKLKTKC